MPEEAPVMSAVSPAPGEERAMGQAFAMADRYEATQGILAIGMKRARV